MSKIKIEVKTNRYHKEWLRPDEVKKILALPDIDEKYEGNALIALSIV
ncbi:hypothetical protein [Methanolobus sp.]|nr:hypothetical protein [Methanolobus sp.]